MTPPSNAYCKISTSYTISTPDYGNIVFSDLNTACYYCKYNLIYFVDQIYTGLFICNSLNYYQNITRF